MQVLVFNTARPGNVLSGKLRINNTGTVYPSRMDIAIAPGHLTIHVIFLPVKFRDLLD
jgi:hypothetical protein